MTDWDCVFVKYAISEKIYSKYSASWGCSTPLLDGHRTAGFLFHVTLMPYSLALARAFWGSAPYASYYRHLMADMYIESAPAWNAVSHQRILIINQKPNIAGKSLCNLHYMARCLRTCNTHMWVFPRLLLQSLLHMVVMLWCLCMLLCYHFPSLELRYRKKHHLAR